MGHDLTKEMAETVQHELGDDLSALNRLPSWLDELSRDAVRDIVLTLSQDEPDLLAVVLFGSVARHAERPLHDPEPSDVDLLAIIDMDDDPVCLPRGREITHTIGLARSRHLEPPRDIQVMFGTRTLREWDPTFVASVVYDGIALWTRDVLPTPLAALADHPFGE